MSTDPSPWPRHELVLDDTRLVYIDEGQGEAVVLLHGYPQSHLTWRKQIEPLSKTHRVLALDWFGWGESERNPDLDMRTQVEGERLGRVLDALGLDRPNLFLHDYAGYIGLELLAKRPDGARRVAILNSRSHQTFPGWFYWASKTIDKFSANALLRPLIAPVPLAFVHRNGMRPYIKRGCFDMEILRRYTDWMATAEGKRWFLSFFNGYHLPARPELLDAARQVEVPTALVWGAQDPFCPISVAEELVEAFPNATLTRIEGADHYVMEERPDEVLAALQSLLAR